MGTGEETYYAYPIIDPKELWRQTMEILQAAIERKLILVGEPPGFCGFNARANLKRSYRPS